ncbi:hypothetical protein E4T66_18110 [Sinimarinibacterium sp. CAU 1509]|uniref:hypothetical protein n=1 Tax=Sinimarinibacterium sp. CAU 1509 TaxID=2562283 RepID=UPI0010AD1214|nr:hypothetical protein [Sinimarinibacterium sp. CAU 1509]TJY57320.1 hypothetical protein E4T66_18110 [Sinimarinibacterium sp. CAU 1509]
MPNNKHNFQTTKTRIARYAALGLDSTRDVHSAQGLLLPLHALEQFQGRHGADPQTAVVLVNHAVLTKGRSTKPGNAYETIQYLTYQASTGTFIRILVDANTRAVTTVLAPGQRTEPPLESTWRSSKWEAVCAATADPVERRWHCAERDPDLAPSQCSNLRAHVLSNPDGELVKVDLGIVPIALDADMPDQVTLAPDDLQRCLAIFRRHRWANLRSLPGVLTLELRVWGVRKVRVRLDSTGYADTYDQTGAAFNHAFKPAYDLQEMAA